MKKNKLITLIVLIIIILSASFYYFGNGKMFHKCPSFFEYKEKDGYKWIDCAPGDRFSKWVNKQYCTKEYMKWIGNNCPNIDIVI